VCRNIRHGDVFIVKYVLDTVFSLIFFILLSPVLILICVLILVTDGPPVFFVQERLGLKRNLFHVYKFRTMVDGKITSAGRLLRGFGLDELPQLLNILKGEMSFVGPRPLEDKDVRHLGWDTEFHDLRWNVKPGITGPGQLSRICDADMTWSLDTMYVENHSAHADLQIIWNTLCTIFIGKKPEKESLVRKQP